MNAINIELSPSGKRPSILIGFLLYLGYLAIFFTTWTVNKVDYLRIGENAQTVRLWYALPTLLGGAFLVLAISLLGWWKLVLFDKTKSGPRWVWVLPVAMAGIILNYCKETGVEEVRMAATPKFVWARLSGRATLDLLFRRDL